jgi:hypothetical protein
MPVVLAGWSVRPPPEWNAVYLKQLARHASSVEARAVPEVLLAMAAIGATPALELLNMLVERALGAQDLSTLFTTRLVRAITQLGRRPSPVVLGLLLEQCTGRAAPGAGLTRSELEWLLTSMAGVGFRPKSEYCLGLQLHLGAHLPKMKLAQMHEALNAASSIGVSLAPGAAEAGIKRVAMMRSRSTGPRAPGGGWGPREVAMAGRIEELLAAAATPAATPEGLATGPQHLHSPKPALRDPVERVRRPPPLLLGGQTVKPAPPIAAPVSFPEYPELNCDLDFQF